jgi:PTH1 family peptidyl-tRNA hydrolase
MRLIVGLGNPGAQYAGNRHNVGFMAADEIQRRHGAGAWRSRFQSAMGEANLGERRLLLMKPMTFMNESGRAVCEAARFYKLEPGEIAVIHDELDLAPGKLRVKRGGGTAGHNGLRSIDAHIGPDFWRLRIGIGHPGDKRLVLPYVLRDFDAEDKEWLGPTLSAIAEALPLLADDQDNRFTTKLALLLKPPPAKPAALDKDGKSESE